MNYMRTLFIAIAACVLQVEATLASPFCLPPGPADAAVMRAAPTECLFYLGWNGAGKPDAKSQNQTEQLLAEAEIQEFVSKLEAQVSAVVRQAMRGNPAAAALGDDLPALVKGVLTRPVAVYVSSVTMGPMGPDIHAGLVINTGDMRPMFAKAVAQFEALALNGAPPGSKFEESKVAGAVLHRAPLPPGQPVVVWGFKDNYFLISVGPDAGKGLVARLVSGSPPEWLTKAQEQADIKRPGRTWYVNVAGILQTARPFITDPKAAATLDALGITTVSSISSVSGFDDTGMASKTLVASSGEPKGLFSLLAGEPLTASDLQPVPKDASFAVAARLDLADVFRRVLEAIAQVDPAAHQMARNGMQATNAQLGFSISDDLLAALGDVWCAYTSEPKANAAKGAPPAGNLTLTVTVRDRKRLGTSYPVIVKLLEQQAAQSNGAWSVKQSKFRDNEVYYVPIKLPQAPVAPLPVPLNFDTAGSGLTPCWCLTDDRLIVSSTPQGLKDFLTRDAKAESLAARKELAGWFKSSDGPSIIMFQDTAAALRAAHPKLQAMLPLATAGLAGLGLNVQIPPLPALATLEGHARPSIFLVQNTPAGLLLENHQTLPIVNSRSLVTSGVGVALLLPAVQAAREAARRSQSTNNLKQIGLGMHNFADVNKAFPAAAVLDKQGKPLLSWRVQILPYVGELALYQSFHLDEPWDSDHNKALIARMPVVFRNPNLPAANEGKTNYLAVVGDKWLIQPKRGTTFGDIRDGTSNTIMAVEARADRAVIWTKPDDWAPDEKDPTAGLLGFRPGIFLALFADGSVRPVQNTIDVGLFKALLTRNGAEAINFGGK